MIINVAGTSGSGKSTLVRRLLEDDAVHSKQADYIEGRKTPIGYHLSPLPGSLKATFLVGAYEAAGTGGCDTIKDICTIYDLVQRKHESGYHVLYEGLFVMNMTRGPKLVRACPGAVNVLKLTTSLEECVASINVRRAAKGVEPITNLKNTEGNFKRADNYWRVMRDAGATIFRVSRDEALPKLKELLST